VDQATLDTFRHRLETEREDLVRELKDMGVDPVTGAPADVEFEHGFADSGHAAAEKAGLLSIAETLVTTLREVGDALERMERGTYGVCQNCSTQIPAERLDARPQASLCMTCKTR
jgi:RNA polymerase-binding protein DksA